ncbi:hypothetical protein CU048_09830 [Beijerinckiaceae bacterium]|nr:hypothetical protein CU048_09830 [Beijerinckiaceae bacterium]
MSQFEFLLVDPKLTSRLSRRMTASRQEPTFGQTRWTAGNGLSCLSAFGGEVDYAIINKIYGTAPEAARRRYSPAECIG